MSSMLEQAIVDAKSLREAALKNAEQAIIEQYAPKIKEAVESMLSESDGIRHIGERVKYEGRIYEVSVGSDGGQVGLKELDGKTHMVNESEVSDLTEQDLLQEEEAMGGSSAGNEAGGSPIMAPFGGNPRVDPERTVEYSVEMEEPIYKFNLEDLKAEMESEEQTGEEAPPQESTDDLLGDLDLGVEPEAGPGEPEEPEGNVLSGLDLQEDLVTEIESILKEIANEDEEELLEEELIVDLAGVNKGGWTETFAPTIGRQYEEELANMQSTKYIEENEVLNQKLKDLKENYKKLQMKNKQYKETVELINEKLNETLLSNAKLLYSNKTLSDASLNERQKSKIVEAIAKVKTHEEAKTLYEALNATVTSGNDKKKGPRTLSESVNRRSNLSSILPRRRKQATEDHNFSDRMQKLAGIK